jgi:hypothetical protein
MDEKVLQELKLAFACDLYETIKAARKNRDEHIFRHSMAEEDDQMVFASVFPKKDLLEFPDLSEEFIAKLQTFNLIGVVTDGKSKLDMFYLGGLNKPFTSLSDGLDIVKILVDEPMIAFLEMYFKIKGIMMNFKLMDYDEFIKVVESEVFKNTSFGQMTEAQEFLSTLKN